MKKWDLNFASFKTSNDIFEAVKSGEKTIETRPRNKESKNDYSNMKPGDVLVMRSNDTGEKIERKATFVHVYDSVEDLANNEPVDKILPGVKTSEELVKVFEELKNKWGKRYKEKLEKHGIVAIGLE